MANGFGKNPRILRNSGSRVKNKDMMFVAMVFIGLIIAVVLIQPIADTENEITSTNTLNNDTITLPTSVGGTLDLTGRDFVSTTAIVNRTNASVDLTPNVSISDGLASDGTKTVILTLDGDTILSNGTQVSINGSPANVSYVYRAEGDLGNASDRAIANVIVIFASIGALVFVIVMLFKGTFADLMRRFG